MRLFAGEPNYIAARDAMRRMDDEITNGESTAGEIDVVMAAVDAALNGIVLDPDKVLRVIPDYIESDGLGVFLADTTVADVLAALEETHDG